MENIPRRPKLSCAALSGIVVSESINDNIPKRAIPRDQHFLGHPNPNVIKDKIPATEIANLKVLGLLNRPPMFSKAVG